MTEMSMPRLSDTMEEGTILQWMKAEGEHVTKGEPLVEVETDKANMVVESPADGVLHLIAAEGDTLDVGAPIARIGDGATPTPEPAIAPLASAPDAGVDEAVVTGIPVADDGTAPVIGDVVTTEPRQVVLPPHPPAPTTPSIPAPPAAPGGGRIPASPLARNIAARADLDLASVRGTGPGGRIVKADVEAGLAAVAAARPQAPTPPPPAPTGAWPGGRRTPLTRLQHTIARRMTEAHAIPDFTLERDVDTTALAAARADLRVALAEARRPSVNDLVVRAVAMAVRERPDMASRLEGDDLVVPDGVHVGVAVSVPGGLIVPVVRDADRKSVPDIAEEVRDLARRGRAGELTPAELEGSVISVTNLGMFGIDRFHAVINAPEAAILAVGRAVPRPVVVDGHVVVREVMTLSLSADHRVIYGAEAATFLGRVAELIEHPAALLV